jgi:polyhydroxybutyrate depolymerase
MKYLFRLLLGLLFVSPLSAVRAETDLVRREWTVAGVQREALLHGPADAGRRPAPVVFVFHGHGGSMRQAAASQPVHQLWPEAIVVYLQGLPTVGRLTNASGRENGWQAGPGDDGDRDLKFFDTVLHSLRTDFQVDEKRIYSTGHSNGGSFTYLLWATRRDVFAAFGPSAAVAGRDYGRLRPAPVIHIAGEHDELVKFAWQQLMIGMLRRTNQCGEGRSLGKGCTLYESKIGAPVMTYIHPGTHRYPPEATQLIVDFFKAHPRP